VANALENDNWIAETMHNMSAPLLAELILLWIEVDAANFDSSNSEADTMSWSRTANERYSASSAYQMQFAGSLKSTYPVKIWQVWAPSRCKFFAWLLLQNRIWTTDTLMLQEWPNEYFCPLYYHDLETAAHLMSECPTSCFIWEQIENWCDLPRLRPRTGSRAEPWLNGSMSYLNLPT
jgi:hypothetical protein